MVSFEEGVLPTRNSAVDSKELTISKIYHWGSTVFKQQSLGYGNLREVLVDIRYATDFSIVLKK